ncbi:uncharacterized protein [Ptychodera flava]|uniref:uncharacterized protein n=1 Tax=Ptychodera flava TaxID=63121 RepID=UPI00396A00A5
MGCASSKALVEREKNTNIVENIIHGSNNKSKGYSKPSVPIVLDPRPNRSSSSTTFLKNDREIILKRPNGVILERARSLVREIKPNAEIDDDAAIKMLQSMDEEEFIKRITESAQRKRPKRPGIPEVTGGSCRELTINWEKSAGNVDRYEIFCTSVEANDKQYVGSAAGDVDEFTIRNLTSATEYEVEVIAVSCRNAVILKSKPTEATFSTGAYFNSGIRTKELKKKSATVRWDPAIGHFDTYCVVHQGPDGEEVEDAYLDKECTTCKVDGLEPGVTYKITVRIASWDSPVKGDEASIEVSIDKMSEDRAYLKTYIKTVVDKENLGLIIEIDRNKPILDQCKGHYLNASTQILRGRPEVEFSDSKETCDIGGPRREFFSLLMQSIMTGYLAVEDDEDDEVMLLFEGEMDHKILVHDDILLGKEIFNVAGRMVQHSIMWGGPGLVGIAQSVKDYLRTGSQYEVVLSLTDIPDMEMRDALQKFNESKGNDLQKIQEIKEFISMLKDAGIVNTDVNEGNKEAIYQELLLHNIIRKRQCELDQFRRGFDSLSLVKFLKQHPGVCDVIFPQQKDSVVKYCEVSQLVRFDKKDSPEKRMASRHFMRYLQDCEQRQSSNAAGATSQNAVSLSEVLQFITGCPVLPPRSYGKIRVNFHSHKLPIAETCNQELYIPVNFENYEQFRDCMDDAISSCAGFGLT